MTGRLSKVIRRADAFLIVVLIVFICAQIAVVFMYGDSYYLGDFAEMDNDDVKYVRSGLKLVEDFKLYYRNADYEGDMASVFVMPGYPLFLAFFLKLFGAVGLSVPLTAESVAGALLAVRLVQGLLQVGVILLLYRIGMKFFSVWVARLAIIFYVLYIPNLETPLLILTETVFTFFFVVLLWLSLEAVASKRLRYYVGAGVVLGMAVMIRPTVLLFPLVILLIWLLKKIPVRDMLKYALVVGCIVVAMLAPWWIRNAVEFDRFIPLTLSSGNPFMQGAFIKYDFSEMSQYLVDFPPDTDSLVTDQAEMAAGKKRLRDSWQARPLATVCWYTWGKFAELWRFPFYTRLLGQGIFRVSFNVVTIFHWLLLGLACLGAVVNCLKGEVNRRLKLLLPASAIYMAIVYLPYFTCARYAYPLMPIVLLLAACGVCGVARRLRSREVRG
ncbi:MAG: glycosyltransferase family 39 protein [Peptococcaceae bacterium]|nr:glycosyltransferase family 39 protein [Peptococcaceae bacterium]